MKRTLALLLSSLLLSGPALAQETVDLGTLRNDEIQVVQKLLYPKEDRTELGFALGVLAFDPYMIAPKIQVSFGKHLSEELEVEGQLGLGYGLGRSTYRELRESYFETPEAYRYLTSLTAGVNWSPIYAKMNFMGNRVVHHDLYVPVVGGLTVERLAWGPKHFAFAPTVGLGVGVRVFQGDKNLVRLEVRDDILIENRKQSGTVAIKQNVGIHVGFSRLGDKK
ncbi:MAG: outer membrane beta-barrel domain-containing protein [Alphaproteobacteria bacterium]|nr:outer membrane beta-barrel domain-containing protein [Alphaproteobacteria bacterium]